MSPMIASLLWPFLAGAAAQVPPPLTTPATGQFGVAASTGPQAFAPNPAPLTGQTTGPLPSPFAQPGANFSQPLPAYPFQAPGAFAPQLPSSATVQPPFQAAPLAPLPGGTTSQAQPIPQSIPGGAAPAPVRKAAILRRLDEGNWRRRRALSKEFAERKKKLLDTDEWKLSSRSERKAMLKQLREEFRAREERLRSSYLTDRQRILGRQT